MKQATREQTVPNSSSNPASEDTIPQGSQASPECGGLTVLVTTAGENRLVGMTWVPLSRAHFQRVGVLVHKNVCMVHIYTDSFYINPHLPVSCLGWGYF